MTAPDDKRRLRAIAEKSRSALSEADRRIKSERLCERLIRDLAEERKRVAGGSSPGTGCAARTPDADETREDQPVLFSYVPFRTEVDIRPVIEWAWSHGVAVAAPRTLERRGFFELRLLRAWSELVSGKWGIPEPGPECPLLDEPVRIDWMVVPGMAFDRKLRRLGYGGGYYDRWFEARTSRDLPLPARYAAAFDVQIVPEIPEDRHDVRMTRIYTESCVYGGDTSESGTGTSEGECK